LVSVVQILIKSSLHLNTIIITFYKLKYLYVALVQLSLSLVRMLLFTVACILH
ncbi:hypothetical protein L9F63_023656, partial [Diploptera punctata]